jgi:hypothetical protein
MSEEIKSANKTDVSVTKATPQKSLAASMAAQYGMEAGPFVAAIRQTVFPASDRKGNPPTDGQLVAYLAVCKRYGLDPFVKQLWPFPTRDGGFQPVTSYDGWIYIMNTHPQYAGDEYQEIRDDNGSLLAGEVKIYRKDRERPTIKRCHLKEWRRETENWRTQESHMMEVRTYAQGIRKAFGIGGIMDAEDAIFADAKDITSASTEIERSTENAKEKLKEKIGAKKAVTEEVTGDSEAATLETEQQPPTTGESESSQEPQEPLPTQTQKDKLKEDMKEKFPDAPEEEQPPIFEEDLPPEPQPEPEDRLITKEERLALLNILKEKAPSHELQVKVEKLARARFSEMGYRNTKEIKLSDYAGIIQWAKGLKVE